MRKFASNHLIGEEEVRALALRGACTNVTDFAPAQRIDPPSSGVFSFAFQMANASEELMKRTSRRGEHGFQFTRCKGGAFHFPSRASGLGQYSRMTAKNGPFGAGSQFASLSAPGEAFWTYSVMPPSASRLRFGSIGELIR